MPPPTFRSLRTVQTHAQIRALILALFGVLGFQVTSWQDFSFPSRVVEALVTVLADIWLFVSEVAGGAYGETSRGFYRRLWAWDRFRIQILAARFTTGRITLTDVGGGPHNIGAGGLIVTDDDGRHFQSTEAVSVPLNGSATVAVRAVAEGATYNIPSGVPLQLVTSFVGLTATNPPQVGTETWISTAGADEEDEDSLYLRAIGQWDELSIATPSGYYESKLRKAIPTLTKIRVRDDNPIGPGSCELILATGAGPASGGDVTAANSFLRTLRSVGAGVLSARAAVARDVHVGGTCYVQASSKAQASADVAADLTKLQVKLPIAGTVYSAEITRIVKSKDGVRNFVPATPDLTVGDDEVATLHHEITYVAE